MYILYENKNTCLNVSQPAAYVSTLPRKLIQMEKSNPYFININIRAILDSHSLPLPFTWPFRIRRPGHDKDENLILKMEWKDNNNYNFLPQ